MQVGFDTHQRLTSTQWGELVQLDVRCVLRYRYVLVHGECGTCNKKKTLRLNLIAGAMTFRGQRASMIYAHCQMEIPDATHTGRGSTTGLLPGGLGSSS